MPQIFGMNYTALISTDDLHHYLEDSQLVVVDCRFSLQDTKKAQQDYFSAHIPGAHYAHLDDDLSGPIIPGKTSRHPLPDIDHLTTLFSSWGIDASKQVVVYDQKSGAIAARLWWMLKWLGHERAAVLEGGWNAWTNKGYPEDGAVPQVAKAEFVASEQKEWLVDVNFVDQIRKNPNYDLVDSRAAKRYAGIEEPIDPIAGHIPGAINIPFMDNVNQDGIFLEQEALADRFKSVPDPKQTIFYCGSGVTACHNILAYYHLGMGMPKLYAGSWSEWIVDKEREIG